MIRGRKIAFVPYGSFEGMRIQAVCETLKEIGYDAVEWTPHFADPWAHTGKELEALAAVPKTVGLEVSEIIVQRDFVVPDRELLEKNISYVIESIKRFSSCGINTINLFTGPVPWCEKPFRVGEDILAGKAWDMVFHAFDAILPVAQQNGMTIALENVWGMLCHDFYSAYYLINRYNSPALGINFDPSHDILCGNSDLAFLIGQWGGKIKHAHLKDAVGIQRKGKFLFPLIGEGMADWKSFFRAFDRIGYRGYYSVEFESCDYVRRIWKDDWAVAARTALESLRILLEDMETESME